VEDFKVNWLDATVVDANVAIQVTADFDRVARRHENDPVGIVFSVDDNKPTFEKARHFHFFHEFQRDFKVNFT
jgi:hypothetical protein